MHERWNRYWLTRSGCQYHLLFFFFFFFFLFCFFFSFLCVCEKVGLISLKQQTAALWALPFKSPKNKFVKLAATWQKQQTECVSSEDSDQPGHPPSLISVFAVRMKNPWVLSCPLNDQQRLAVRMKNPWVLSCPLNAQQRLWSDWADAQADLSLRWTHSHFVGFVMSRLK